MEFYDWIFILVLAPFIVAAVAVRGAAFVVAWNFSLFLIQAVRGKI